MHALKTCMALCPLPSRTRSQMASLRESGMLALQSRLANGCKYSYLGATNQCIDSGLALFVKNPSGAGVKWRISYVPPGVPGRR